MWFSLSYFIRKSLFEWENCLRRLMKKSFELFLLRDLPQRTEVKLIFVLKWHRRLSIFVSFHLERNKLFKEKGKMIEYWMRLLMMLPRPLIDRRGRRFLILGKFHSHSKFVYSHELLPFQLYTQNKSQLNELIL